VFASHVIGQLRKCMGGNRCWEELDAGERVAAKGTRCTVEFTVCHCSATELEKQNEP
jgi:hypothetical protein